MVAKAVAMVAKEEEEAKEEEAMEEEAKEEVMVVAKAVAMEVAKAVAMEVAKAEAEDLEVVAVMEAMVEAMEVDSEAVCIYLALSKFVLLKP
jgi:aspartyl aminopeptidase